MVDDLTCIFPRYIHDLLFYLSRLGTWVTPEVAEVKSDLDKIIPRSIYNIHWGVLNAAPECREKASLYRILNDEISGGTHLRVGFLECGAKLIKDGPKLFSPTAEQFESFEHVDLHIPIADFRSPYPALVVKIPNEWRAAKSRELGIDGQRQPRHVAVRTSVTTAGKVHIFSILHYHDFDHMNVVTDQPLHSDLQSAFSYAADVWLKEDLIATDPIAATQTLEVMQAKEFEYCRDAIHAAYNCCLMMVNYGHREGGYLDPRLHRTKQKRGDRSHLADFKAVDMLQNIVIRQTSGMCGEVPVGSVADHADGQRLWEVKPHWRRGHWRRKPGWQAYVERNEKPPLSFVRPTLVRKDRVVGDVSESQATYTVR